MTRVATQLSLIPDPRVLVRYHPEMPPPEAGGPFDFGTFAAWVAGWPELCGYGEDEGAAVLALAGVLRELDADPRQPLTTLGQIATAVGRLLLSPTTQRTERISLATAFATPTLPTARAQRRQSARPFPMAGI